MSPDRQERLISLLVFSVRALARLRAQNAAIRLGMEELRIRDASLSESVDFAQVELDALQDFYEQLERIDPEIAAMIDDRDERAFDVDGVPGKPFLD